MIVKCDGGWGYIKDDDNNLPFIKGFTCPSCAHLTKHPIQVKQGNRTMLYCPNCKGYIKNASKKELKRL